MSMWVYEFLTTGGGRVCGVSRVHVCTHVCCTPGVSAPAQLGEDHPGQPMGLSNVTLPPALRELGPLLFSH
jgi:hypothetical protein